MKKIITVEIILMLLVIVGLLYPMINNTKSRTIVPIVWTTDTSIMTEDSIIYVVDTSLVKHFNDDEEITVYFNSDNEIISKRETRKDDIMFYFRTTSMPHYFVDKNENKIGPSIVVVGLLLFFYLLAIIISSSDNINLRFHIKTQRINLVPIHLVIEGLFIMMLHLYLFTYFQTGWFSLLILSMITLIHIILNNSWSKIEDIFFTYERLRHKKIDLKNNYEKLIK